MADPKPPQNPQKEIQSSEDIETEKLKHELEEEKLKNQIHKLRASSVDIWVKEIKSIVLLAVFILGSIVNVVSYVLTLIGKKIAEAMPSPPSSMGITGVGEGGIGVARHADMVMAGSHTLWQLLLFAFLIPLVIDWFKKRKNKKRGEER
jgi:hypothetical protein